VLVIEKEEQGETTGRVYRRLLPTMSSRLVIKLSVSGRERKGSARERASGNINKKRGKGTVEEKEGEVEEKEQGGITGRVTRGMLPAMASRIATKLSVSGRERSTGQTERASGNDSLEGCCLLCPFY
jgi:hypothetical protein